MEEITFKFKVPVELREDIEKSYSELSKLAREFIIAKAFEMHLSKSKNLQRAVFEVLSSKSKLTEEDAKSLASEIDNSAYKLMENECSEQ